MNEACSKITIEYDDRSVRRFLLASVIWGAVGMLVGVIIATQLTTWKANLNLEWLTFGRLRPLHTNAVVFAFVGNMMFAGIYYSTQRLCKVRMASDLLSSIHFWGWQFIIVCAAISLPLGYTRGKEYAELIWPINIMVAVIWVIFGINFFWTLMRRNEPSLYVALWFYIATIVTVAMLYIVNHLSLPTSWLHSYPIFGGVQDALVQWWYGHNAVAFFLTTPILGIMYYFLPKAAERPVYSYRLSIVHFWSLVFLYIWAGPHHLLNTSLPHWLQMLGSTFSLMLWAPSWGGMLNGLLTLRGAWDKLRTDPVIKFLAAGVTFYGMATFEGPLLSIRAVNALSHYSDWTIGHVHSGALGWNGFMAAGMFYWLAPRLWNTKLHSKQLANWHFWIGLIGILLYVGAMWTSGVRQGLMLNATRNGGSELVHPQFMETLDGGYYALMAFRTLGGTLYLTGHLLMCYNLWKTIRAGTPVNETREVFVEAGPHQDRMGWKDVLLTDPLLFIFGGMILLVLWLFLPNYANLGAFAGGVLLCILGIRRFRQSGKSWGDWYECLVENYLPFTVLTLVAVAAGGIIQIIPTITVNTAKNVEDRVQKLYTPLELAGRDIYVNEGCYLCHSQQIRTMVPDVLRYGDPSRLGESIYDHPFQWGSKRTGPDLARIGGKYPSIWHYNHMINPRSINAYSIMPSYSFLFDKRTDVKALPAKIAVLARLGVPYPAMNEHEIEQGALDQGKQIRDELVKAGASPKLSEDSELVALISYLQKEGQADAVVAPPATVPLVKRPLRPGLPDALRAAASSNAAAAK